LPSRIRTPLRLSDGQALAAILQRLKRPAGRPKQHEEVKATVTVRRILLVDDEDHIREVAQVSLEMTAGWEVLTAGSGSEGLAKAAAEQPDVILLDMMMPDMDGPATFQRLRANQSTRHIPVVLLTAKVQAADRRRFAGLGVAGVIAKPFDPLGLAGQVAATLGWGR
jgi:CheY-like chemotaxis protein